jgi:hypothetical protein
MGLKNFGQLRHGHLLAEPSCRHPPRQMDGVASKSWVRPARAGHSSGGGHAPDESAVSGGDVCAVGREVRAASSVARARQPPMDSARQSGGRKGFAHADVSPRAGRRAEDRGRIGVLGGNWAFLGRDRSREVTDRGGRKLGGLGCVTGARQLTGIRGGRPPFATVHGDRGRAEPPIVCQKLGRPSVGRAWDLESSSRPLPSA